MITACNTDPQFNLRAALAKLDGDVTFLKDLSQLFLETLPERLDTLKSAMLKRESQTISDVAHSIKGSVRFFVADAAFEAAQRLESISASGQSTDNIEDACDEMLYELQQLRLELLFFLASPEHC